MDRIAVCGTVDLSSILSRRTEYLGEMRRIGKAATSKVAGRKAMGVRVPLSPPTILFFSEANPISLKSVLRVRCLYE